MPFPGSVFAQSGRFTEIYPIGRGAAGQVYAARDNLGRRVAVKEALPTSEGFAAFRTKFEKESQLQAGLNHPNIVRVYHLEEDPSTNELYLICEYADAGSLADYLERHGPLAETEALAVALDICAALEETQRRQIVHRDIKPSNILLSQSEGGGLVAKLGDFGIAQDSRLRKTTILPGTTHPGTPLYMAPEQADIATVLDTRTDIYALGVTLWEMLTGQDYKLLLRDTHLPALRDFKQSATAGTEAIIRRAVQSNRALRYQAPAELRADLQRVLEGRAPAKAAPPERWLSRAGEARPVVRVPQPMLFGAAVIGTLGIGMLGWFIWGASYVPGLFIAAFFVGALLLALGLLARSELQAGRGLRILLLLLVLGTFGACVVLTFAPAVPNQADVVPAPVALLFFTGVTVLLLLGAIVLAQAMQRAGRHVLAIFTLLGGAVLAGALLFGTVQAVLEGQPATPADSLIVMPPSELTVPVETLETPTPIVPGASPPAMDPVVSAVPTQQVSPP